MNRTFKPNRQGITLLFVISMIVLFLLLGTAFVTVANNFNRESNNRIRSSLPEDTRELSNRLFDEAILQLIRGPKLRNIDSPLRTNDILSDQYGYGFKSFVAGADIAPRMVGGGAFVEISFTSDPDVAAADGKAFDLLTLSTEDEDVVNLSPNTVNNFYGGQVLSFTSGPASGFSARIYSDYFDPNDNHHFPNSRGFGQWRHHYRATDQF